MPLQGGLRGEDMCTVMGEIDVGVCTMMGGIGGTGGSKGMEQDWIAPGRGGRPRVFCKGGNFAEFMERRLCQGLFFGGVAGLGPAALLGGGTLAQVFFVNFAKFFRTAFLTTHLRWLLLARGFI